MEDQKVPVLPVENIESDHRAKKSDCVRRSHIFHQYDLGKRTMAFRCNSLRYDLNECRLRDTLRLYESYWPSLQEWLRWQRKEVDVSASLDSNRSEVNRKILSKLGPKDGTHG